MKYDRPKIGIGVIIKRDGKVLLGKRKNAHGAGSWCFPGGHLEFGELIEDCARREVLEEAGININNVAFAPYTNDIFDNEKKHYVTLFVTAGHESGEVRVMEEDKCERWEWFKWDNLPQPIFIPISNLIKRGYSPFE